MGFFDNTNIELINNCSSCTGRTNCKHPCLDNYKGSNDILLLFSSPYKFEDLTGIPFSGNIYDWYEEQFNAIGISFKDCSKIHITGCYSEDARTLTKYKKKCENRVIDFIKECNPKLIIAFGSDTLELTKKDYTRDISNSTRWRGFLMPFKSYGMNTWIMTTFSYEEVCLQESLVSIIKKKEAKDKKLITTPKEVVDAVSFHSNYKIAYRLFLTDIRSAVIGYKKPIPEDPANSISINVLKDKNEIIHYLRETYVYLKANPNATLTLDLETNGLKPYNKDKRVYSCAIYADPELGSFSFPLNTIYATRKYNKTDDIPKADGDIVAELKHIAELNPRVVGANYKFDMVQLKVILGVELEHCVFDTVVVAHLLDPRDGITSLKFNTYIYYGIAYEEGIHDYLKSSDEDKDKYGTNALNDIFNAPIDDVLYYNALDVIYTYNVMKEQMKLWREFPNPNKWFAFKLFHKVIPVLAHMEMNGILIDKAKLESSKKLCEEEIKKIEERIKDDPVWIKWGEIVGVDKRSILSASQIIEVFINHMHLHPHGISAKEKAKADLEWLSKLVDQEPFIDNILQYRKYTKILHTYLEGLQKEMNDDGRVRSFFTVNNVSSYRIASNSPNFQNMSSRDEFQVDLIKKCFIPDEGCNYTSFDFSALENYGSACITKDPYMISVLVDNHDMHKENALFCFGMTEEEFQELKKYDTENGTHYAKTARNGGKAASFSTLYSAGKQTIGTTLWKYMTEKNVHVTPTELAKDRVIKKFGFEAKYIASKSKEDKEEAFLNYYIDDVAGAFLEDFWSRRMCKTKLFKENLVNNYFATGIVNYPMGCSVKGLFSTTFLTNCIIQGSSSSITLWCLIMLDYLYRYFKINSHPNNIIHDDITQCVHNQELIKAMSVQKAVMEECTRFAFPWLSINLKAECEVSPVGTSWADKKEYAEFLDYYKRNKDKIVEAIGKAIDYDWTFNNWR